MAKIEEDKSTGTHIITIGRKERQWRFEDELFTLLDKVKGQTETRPVIVTIQVGNTRWVVNSNGEMPK